jgi:glucose/arabinose dehydrogenase
MIVMSIRLTLYAILAVLSASCIKEDPPLDIPDDTPVEITSSVLTEDLNFPWEILWGPDNMIWMTERDGKISRVNPSTGEVSLLLDIDEVVSTGEGGLLGMALYPAFTQPTHLYVAYDYEKAGNYTGKVVRYNYNSGTLSDPVAIVDDLKAAGIHNGCRLAISPDSKLYITTGDASDQSTPQNLSSKNGKILRVNLDGTIPADNPDPSSPVWSSGHRNPQGLVFVGDSLFSSEHGPDTDDEINIIRRGGNYGWPDVRGVCSAPEQSFCDEHDVVEPLNQWTPTIAVCGIDYYAGNLIPQWKNSILMATLKNQRLVQLKLSDDLRSFVDLKEFFINDYGRMRDVCVAPDGRVFICTSNGGNSDVLIEVNKKQ